MMVRMVKMVKMAKMGGTTMNTICLELLVRRPLFALFVLVLVILVPFLQIQERDGKHQEHWVVALAVDLIDRVCCDMWGFRDPKCTMTFDDEDEDDSPYFVYFRPEKRRC